MLEHPHVESNNKTVTNTDTVTDTDTFLELYDGFAVSDQYSEDYAHISWIVGISERKATKNICEDSIWNFGPNDESSRKTRKKNLIICIYSCKSHFWF